jgi:hypothetical protein
MGRIGQIGPMDTARLVGRAAAKSAQKDSPAGVADGALVFKKQLSLS